MNRAACLAWIKTASLREFLICILILGPITAIGLSYCPLLSQALARPVALEHVHRPHRV